MDSLPSIPPPHEPKGGSAGLSPTGSPGLIPQYAVTFVRTAVPLAAVAGVGALRQGDPGGDGLLPALNQYDDEPPTRRRQQLIGQK